MNTNDVATITGVSVHTLHHYDRIALLSPSRNPDNGYRDYTDEDIDLLQQILFFKECGFSLTRIKEILGSPDFDRECAFELQRNYLLQEQKRIGMMLNTLELSIKSMKGEIVMSHNDKFTGFDFTVNPYEEEARQRWGDRPVDQSKAYLASLTPDERQGLAEGMEDLFTGLARIRHEAPESPEAQQAMAAMYDYFNSGFGYQYGPEAFAGVGQMYITDERFTANIDRYGRGLSKFLAEAMKIYAESRKDDRAGRKNR